MRNQRKERLEREIETEGKKINRKRKEIKE